MAKYRRKPTVVEVAITFDELVEYGKAHGANIVNGMPWSFSYKGHPITHETDDCYLVPTRDGLWRFERGDMLVTDAHGNLKAYKPAIFAATYEPVEDTPTASAGREAEELRDKVYNTLFQAVEQHQGEYVYECATDAVLALVAAEVAQAARYEADVAEQAIAHERVMRAGLQRAEAELRTLRAAEADLRQRLAALEQAGSTGAQHTEAVPPRPGHGQPEVASPAQGTEAGA